MNENADVSIGHCMTAPPVGIGEPQAPAPDCEDRKSTRLNSSHQIISYAVFCLKKKKIEAQISRHFDGNPTAQGNEGYGTDLWIHQYSQIAVSLQKQRTSHYRRTYVLVKPTVS